MQKTIEYTDALEQVAREQARSEGVDIENEPHGFFRFMLKVWADEKLKAEVLKRSRSNNNKG